jgi:hypothetical protein
MTFTSHHPLRRPVQSQTSVKPRRPILHPIIQAFLYRTNHILHPFTPNEVKPLIAVPHIITIDLRLHTFIVHAKERSPHLLVVQLKLVIAKVMADLELIMYDFTYRKLATTLWRNDGMTYIAEASRGDRA